MSNIEYFDILTRDGLTLKGKKMISESNSGDLPKAILCIVHGFGEHQERYHHVGEALNEKNIIVYSFDLRGHGKSEGKRGHAKRYSYLIDDVEELLIFAREEYNNTPIFLMGHSFGGHIVANFLLQKITSEITASIISSPWLKLAFEPPAFKIKLAMMMSKIYPAYSDTSEMDVSRLSRDSQVVDSYTKDPLVVKSISAGLFSGIIAASKTIIDNASNLKIPTLLYHGTADEIISIEGSEQFAKNSNKQLTFRKLNGVYHEPHNDTGKEKVIEMIIEWIDKFA